MKELKIGKRNIEKMNDLPGDIEILSCYNLGLIKLPMLPDSLKEIYCGCNELVELPELPKTLVLLNCFSNKLIELPELPKSLNFLSCTNNKLSKLPTLPNKLVQLYCANNPFECPIEKDIIERYKMNIKTIYTEQKIEEYRTLDYQYFLLDKYGYKINDIVYNFNGLGIEFHNELKLKYDHLFTGLQYNLI